ncbi:MAG: hypothetical protein HYY04_11050 [Chloroflexi bacterium]|nr:hypothetical protein [Chloroflexota bacterium]
MPAKPAREDAPDAADWRPFLATWLVVGVVLLYAPFDLQRRLAEGLQAPLVALATDWLFRRALPRVSSPALRRAIVAVGLAVPIAGTLFLVAQVTDMGLKHPDLLFIRQAEADAFAWLRRSTRPEEVVLATARTGALIPALAGNRVVYGHPMETVDAEARRGTVTAFFSARWSDADRAALLTREPVAYVYVGPRERRPGAANVAGLSALTPVYQSGEVTIYRVAAGSPLPATGPIRNGGPGG